MWDPRPEVIPRQVLEDDLPPKAFAEAYADFSRAIIDAVSDIVPAVKTPDSHVRSPRAGGDQCVLSHNTVCAGAGLYVIG